MPRARSSTAVEKLLEERRKIVDWLERLDSSNSDTPEHIRDKVRGDYQVRLDEIVDKLKTHTVKLRESLAAKEQERAQLSDREQSLNEQLTEAELRHSVGEFDQAKWEGLRSEVKAELAKIRPRMRAADKEMTNLEDVLAQLEEPGIEAPAPTARPSSKSKRTTGRVPKQKAPGEYQKRASGTFAEAKLLEPEPAPADSGKKTERQSDAFDELAFLKSVSEDEEHGPRPSRASGSHVVHGSEPVAPTDKPESIPEPPPPIQPPEPIQLPDPALSASSDLAGGSKTLKCAECGTMNAATEWYCEKCGAELTAP